MIKNFRKILEAQAKAQLTESTASETKEQPKKPSAEKDGILKLTEITAKIRDNMIKIRKETPIKNGIEITFFNNNDRDKAKKLIPNKVEEGEKVLTFYLV